MNEVVLFLSLVALSGIFSATETAFTALNKYRIRYLVEKKKRNAACVKKLKDDEPKLLITLLIGNNLVNVGASAIATALAIRVFGNTGVGIATGIVTFVLLVFGEITPKTLATRHAEEIALTMAKPIELMQLIFWPLVKTFEKLPQLIAPVMGKAKEKPVITEDELKNIVKMGEEEGSIKKIEKELIHNIFRFDDIEVKEVMTPRTDMVVVNADQKLSDVVNFLVNSGHSRFPVYEKRIDNIVGILYLKDVFARLIERKLDVKVRALMKEPLFVPETKIIDSMLREFQRKKIHMAIVVDEHGGVSGLVTIEDVLEEIVGEIIDESDLAEPNIKRISKKAAIVKGKTEIEEVNKRLGLKLKEEKDFETIGGFILDLLGRIPRKGETIELGKNKITVTKLNKQRIEEVRIDAK